MQRPPSIDLENSPHPLDDRAVAAALLTILLAGETLAGVARELGVADATPGGWFRSVTARMIVERVPGIEDPPG